MGMRNAVIFLPNSRIRYRATFPSCYCHTSPKSSRFFESGGSNSGPISRGWSEASGTGVGTQVCPIGETPSPGWRMSRPNTGGRPNLFLGVSGKEQPIGHDQRPDAHAESDQRVKKKILLAMIMSAMSGPT